MNDSIDAGKGASLKGRAVEDAAVAWVLAYELAAGRNPVDRRYERAYPGDIDSPPRVIEIKATATSYRGWFLPLAPIQVEHARSDPAFHLYVVENVGQGDPALFTMRILAGETLRALVGKAVERRHFEVGWPTAHHDATPVVTSADPTGGQLMSIPASAATEAVDATIRIPQRQSDLTVAIADALRTLGGEATMADIERTIQTAHPGRWRSLATAVADRTHPGSPSTLVPAHQRILERIGRGRYRPRI